MRVWPGILSLFLSLPLFAATVNGPSLRRETSGPGNYRNGATVSHETFFGSLFAPVTLEGDYKLIPRAEIFVSNRNYHNSDPNLVPLLDSTKNLQTLSLGAALTRDFGEENQHTLYLTLTHFGSPSFDFVAGHLLESYVGVKINQSLSMLQGMKQQQTYFLLRYRQYPDGPRFLPFFGQYYLWNPGFFADVMVPSHLMAGWQDDAENWRFAAGARFVSADYPFHGSGGTGWMQGSTQEVFFSARRKVWSVFHLAVEGGWQAERLDFRTSENKNLLEMRTPMTPWLQLMLQTVFPVS